MKDLLSMVLLKKKSGEFIECSFAEPANRLLFKIPPPGKTADSLCGYTFQGKGILQSL